MRGTRGWMALALVVALAIAFIAAGCGDDDDDGGDGGGEELGLLSEGTLTVGSDIPFPPFEQGNPPDYQGFDIDLINAVADQIELETEIIDAPFDVILAGETGRFDLSIAATTITEPRENRVDFSDPYFEAEQSLLVQADGEIQSIDDVTADSVVGAQDGTTGERYALDNTDAEVRPFPEIDDAYNALTGGQVDAVFNDLPSTASVASANPDLAVVETFKTDELYGIVFPEGVEPALIDAVNEALATLKEDGTLNDLYQTYFSTDAPETVLEGTHEPT